MRTEFRKTICTCCYSSQVYIDVPYCGVCKYYLRLLDVKEW